MSLKFATGGSGTTLLGTTVLGDTTANPDVVPNPLSISAQSAYPQATVNTAGANLNLAGGIGRRFFTIVTNTGLATKTITLTANGTLVTLTAVAGAPAANQFQVGTDDTAPQLAVTATNLAAAIAAQATLGPLMTPSASAAVVYLAKTPTLNTLVIASGTAGALVTATSGADGVILIPDGTVLLPSLSFSNNDGFFHRGDGTVTILVGGTIAGDFSIAGGLTMGTGLDVSFSRRGYANWNFGSADAVAPVAQTLSFQGARGGTDSDVAGVAATLQGSLGTGLGAGGDILFKVGTPQATGTTQHVAATALTLHNAGAAGVAEPQILASLGAGTAKATVSGTYAKFVSGVGVSNGADTTQDPLWTLTPIPANTFTANGDALVLTLTLATAGNANNKSFGIIVGGTPLATGTVAGNFSAVIATATITRVDATHVNVAIVVPASNVTTVGQFNMNLLVADLTANSLAVVVTGASPTTGAANDVRLFSGFAQFVK